MKLQTLQNQRRTEEGVFSNAVASVKARGMGKWDLTLCDGAGEATSGMPAEVTATWFLGTGDSLLRDRWDQELTLLGGPNSKLGVLNIRGCARHLGTICC